MDSNNIIYPGILIRIKSLFLDYVILILIIFFISFLFKKLDEVPDSLRIGSFIFTFILYEPLFVSLFGGTIGHYSNGIRVKRLNNRNKNILLPIAIFRYIVKITLGWLSLITVNRSEENQAIHDLIANSVVIYKKKK